MDNTVFLSTEALFSTASVAAIGVSIELSLDRLERLRDEIDGILREHQERELFAHFQWQAEDNPHDGYGFRFPDFVPRPE